MASCFHRLDSSSSEENFRLSCASILPKFISPEQSLIDSILLYDKPEQADILLPDGQKYFWYFAIGSMTNPISLYLRDLIPLMSYPATCPDHRITFRTIAGIADVESCLGHEFDGVVHLLTNDQMARLDGIEVFYHRIQVNSIDYQSRMHKVYVYQTNLSDQATTVPHERYLDIIIKGCEYYQVRAEYIHRLRNDQLVIPRRKPENFQSFTNIPGDVYYSLDDLEKHNGIDPSLPLWICINGKILEYTGLPPTDHPDYEFQKSFCTFFSQKLCGREISTLMAKTLYEPLYKLPLTDEDICDEHRAQIEDHYYHTLASSDEKLYWKPIGCLRLNK